MWYTTNGIKYILGNCNGPFPLATHNKWSNVIWANYYTPPPARVEERAVCIKVSKYSFLCLVRPPSGRSYHYRAFLLYLCQPHKDGASVDYTQTDLFQAFAVQQLTNVGTSWKLIYPKSISCTRLLPLLSSEHVNSHKHYIREKCFLDLGYSGSDVPGRCHW